MGGEIVTRCRSCKAVVRWATPIKDGKPQRGSSLLFDAVPVAAREGRWLIDDRGQCRRWQPLFDGYEVEAYEPHWSTCPDADTWRSAGSPHLVRERADPVYDEAVALGVD